MRMTHTVTITDYFNALMKILEDHYVHPERIDRARAQKIFEVIQEDAPDKAYQLHCATAETLWTLNDNHVRFIGPMSVNTEPDHNEPPLPEGRMEAGSIAYVSLPSAAFSERKNGNYTRTGNQVIQALIAQSPIGIILDLRNNHGGDCWQMIAAIAPLLDRENAVSFVQGDKAATTTIRWDHIQHLINYGSETLEFSPKCDAPANESRPIAVIYGEGTRSSGEITALTLRGSHLSKSFGSPTGGFSSCTSSFKTPFKEVFGEATIHLTTANIADRDYTIYQGESIEPDFPCDNPMERAIQWIREFKPS
jgi:carboxyl-terminal processing protease